MMNKKRAARVQVLGFESILARHRRSLSPIIATVLLIALVLVLATIIFFWARGFISERIEKFPNQAIEDTCAKVSFDINLYTDSATASQSLEISNKGNIAIYGFALKTSSGGNSNMQDYNFSVGAGKSTKGVVSLGSGSVIVYPEVLGTVKGTTTNKIYTCLNNGVTIG